MKKILFLVSASLVLSMAYSGSQTWANDAVKRKPASTGTLTGANAAQMVKILESAGIQPSKTLIQGFDMICQGSNFQDFCMVASQTSDPASHRVTIKSTSSGQFWSLLVSASSAPVT